MKFILFFVFSLYILLSISCTHNDIPRQKAYPRFYFPQKEYKLYQSECPFQFQIPVYAEIEKRNNPQDDSCWFNLSFPQWNGKLHVSYKYYADQEVLTKLLEDAYKLTSKHMVKASYIHDSVIDKENLKGLIYSLGGNSASEKQFVLTDYKHQFVRGALYFNSTPNYDSMQPILRYIDSDIYHMIGTFQFR